MFDVQFIIFVTDINVIKDYNVNFTKMVNKQIEQIYNLIIDVLIRGTLHSRITPTGRSRSFPRIISLMS